MSVKQFEIKGKIKFRKIKPGKLELWTAQDVDNNKIILGVSVENYPGGVILGWFEGKSNPETGKIIPLDLENFEKNYGVWEDLIKTGNYEVTLYSNGNTNINFNPNKN